MKNLFNKNNEKNQEKEEFSRNNNEHYEYSLSKDKDKKKKKYCSSCLRCFKDKETNKRVCLILSVKIFGILLIGFILGIASTPGGYTVEEYNSLEKKYKDTTAQAYKLETENSKLEAKVNEAKPWFEMKEEEQKAIEAQLQAQKEAEAKAEEERLAAEQKAKEEAEAKEAAEAEAKEKQGYDTGITYNQLARTPDDYLFEKVKFSGKVIQVIEGTDITQIRLAVDGSYDNILLCEYTSDIVGSRILDDDYITVYGFSSGLITYESTMGGNITIPGVILDKIDN